MRKLIMYIGLCIAALSAVSCQDDVDGEQYEQYASFKAVIGSNGVTDIYVRYKESGKVTYQLPVIISGSTPNAIDREIHVAVDPDTLATLNDARFGREDLYYRLLGEEHYDFPSTLNIKAGTNVDTLGIDFMLQGVDLVEKWVLPLTIEDDPSYNYVSHPRKNYAKALLRVLPFNDYSGTYSTTTNGSRLYKEGIEYQFVSKRIPSLKTRITIDGAWFKTLYSESESYYYRPSVNLGGESLPYMGHYNDPEGYLRNSFNTRFMFDTYLDKLKLGFSVAVECMWLYTSQSIRQTGIPFEYIDLNGEAHPFDTEEALNDAYLQWLIISYSDTQFRKNITEPLNIGVNLKVTKRIFKERIQLALFVDQLFSYWREYVSNGVRIRQTGKMPYFGMEINFSL